MSYWKFTSAEALAAWDDMEKQEAELRKKGKEFAALFGAEPVFQRTINEVRFYGVRFDVIVHVHHALWTKATSKNGFAQMPKVKVPADLKWKSETLWEQWNDHRPSIKVNRDAMFESIGYDWGNLLFAGFEIFRHADVIYVQTKATPKPEAGGVEILGSEYAAAQRAAKE